MPINPPQSLGRQILGKSADWFFPADPAEAALDLVAPLASVGKKLGQGIGRKILGKTLKHDKMLSKPNYASGQVAKDTGLELAAYDRINFTGGKPHTAIWINSEAFKKLPRPERHRILRHEEGHKAWFDVLDQKQRDMFEADFIDRIGSAPKDEWTVYDDWYNAREGLEGYPVEEYAREFFADLWSLAHEPEAWKGVRETLLNNPVFKSIMGSL